LAKSSTSFLNRWLEQITTLFIPLEADRDRKRYDLLVLFL